MRTKGIATDMPAAIGETKCSCLHELAHLLQWVAQSASECWLVQVGRNARMMAFRERRCTFLHRPGKALKNASETRAHSLLMSLVVFDAK